MFDLSLTSIPMIHRIKMDNIIAVVVSTAARGSFARSTAQRRSENILLRDKSDIFIPELINLSAVSSRR
jgi:hypothetical protein